MAYQVKGNVVIDDDGNGFFENLPLILAPSIISPTENESLPLGSNVNVVTTNFSGIYKTFLKSELQVANNISFAASNIVFQSNTIPGSNVINVGFVSGNLFARVRHYSSDNLVSDFSAIRSFSAGFPPTSIGESSAGGFYTGTINIGGGVCYYLIIAPNSTGCAICIWKTTHTATPGSTSCVNGYTNTYGPMDNALHPAGNWTATRTIGGFSDWYLPARDELNVMFTNRGSMPAGEGYNPGNYWSSTESSYCTACNIIFSFGGFGGRGKCNDYQVRAVRRVPIVCT